MSQEKQIISELKAQIEETAKEMNLSYSSMDEADEIAKELASRLRDYKWAVLGKADPITQEQYEEAISLWFLYKAGTNNEIVKNLECAGSTENAHFSLVLKKNGEVDELGLEYAVSEVMPYVLEKMKDMECTH